MAISSVDMSGSAYIPANNSFDDKDQIAARSRQLKKAGKPLEDNGVEQEHSDFQHQVLESTQNQPRGVQSLSIRRDENKYQQDPVSQDLLNQFAAEYLEDTDCEALLEHPTVNRGRLNKTKLEELRASLESDAIPESALDAFIKSGKFSIGEIYIVLTYLFESFKKKRQKFASLISQLLQELEQQESAYLCEFFSLTKNAELKADLEKIDAYAKVATGKVNLSGVKQVIEFIKQSLNDEYDNLISTCMKMRAKFLRQLHGAVLNPENKTQLSDYMEFEKYIIMTYSIYLRIKGLTDSLPEGSVIATNLGGTNNSKIASVMSFNESALISEIALNSLLRGFGLTGLAPKDAITFINLLLTMLGKLPLTAFNSDRQRQIVLGGVRDLQRKFATTVSHEEEKSRFSFINPKKQVTRTV